MNDSTHDRSESLPGSGVNISDVHELPGDIPGSKPRWPKDIESPVWCPAHFPEYPGKFNSDSEVDGSGDSNSDPFLGSGQFIRLADTSISTTDNSALTSPTLALRCNNKNNHKRNEDSCATGLSGLLNLDDAKNEVFSLLDELMRVQVALEHGNVQYMFQCGRVNVFEDLQHEYMRRSDLTYLGNAERCILRREATNAEREKLQGQTEVTRALEWNDKLENPYVVKGKLSAAVQRLFEEAQAALRSLEKVTGQATSDLACGNTAPNPTARAAPYPAWKDDSLTEMTTERWALKIQVEKLEKERAHHRREISRLQHEVDYLRAGSLGSRCAKDPQEERTA